MNAAGLIAFNLLVNGLGSFALAWLVTRIPLRLLERVPGKLCLVLLALPFLKLSLDLLQGIPEGSFLWRRAEGERPELGSVMLGFGFSYGIPRALFVLGALSGGQQYSQSASDLIAAWLTAKVGAWVPLALASVLLAWGALRLGRRARALWQAAVARRAASARAVVRGWRRVGGRWVELFVTDEPAGTPRAAGFVRPYLCFPLPIWRAFTAAERRAAVAHEVAHIAEHHLLWLTLIGVVRDLFWFVPGIARAERAFREACELAADARAVRRGTSPLVLASALVRAREAAPTEPAWSGAMWGATGGSLTARVERLLDRPPQRAPALRRLFHVALTLWVAGMLALSTAFGNY